MKSHPTIDFYFDYLSPYAYIGWFGIQKICAARRLELRPHPVLFAGLLNHWGQLGPAEIPPKREFVYKDTCRLAALAGLPFNSPRLHPFNPLTALRMSLKETSGDRQRDIIHALWHAAWGMGIDMGNPDELVAALNNAGLPGHEILKAAQQPAAKEALKQNTAHAIAHGVFGIPTAIANGELFWGADRLSHLELFLDGQDPLDRRRIGEMLARPRGTDRPKRGPTL